MTLNDFHEIFLFLTFFTHLLVVNLLVGGTPIMAFTHWLGRWEYFGHLRTLGQRMREMSTKVFTLGILLGFFTWVTVYSRYGKPVEDMMGAFKVGYGFLFILVILIFGSLIAFKSQNTFSLSLIFPKWVFLALTIFGLGCMALLFVISHIMTLQPSYTGIVNENGLLASLTLPTLWPRFSHMILGSIAATGILITLYGTLRLPPGQGQNSGTFPSNTNFDIYTTRYGVAWTLVGTLPQIVVGPWLLFVLPVEVREPLVSGSSLVSAVFFVSLTLALLALVLLNASLMVPHVRGLVWSGLGSLFLTFVLMVIIREEVRKGWMQMSNGKGTIEEFSIGALSGVIATVFFGFFFLSRYIKRISQVQRPLA